jgi:iron complex transport system substrate-binding protein
VVRGCEDKGFGFYPRLLKRRPGFLFMKRLKQYIHRLITSQLFDRIILFTVLLFLFFTFNTTLLTLSCAEPPNRIISLAPSTTEILFAAGLEERIVGVTSFCDYPEEAKHKPKIGGMSNPSIEAVLILKPDIVVMTTDGNPPEFEQKLRSLGIKTFIFKALTLQELPDGIRKMGTALDEREKFETLASDIEQTMHTFKTQKPVNRQKVLFIVWPAPLIAAGKNTAVDDAIKLLGGINIAGSAQGRYPKYSIEEIFHQSPDIIFIGKGMAGKGPEDMKKLSSNFLSRIASVPAVKNNRVFYVSDSLFRLGPRVIDGIKELAGYLQ